MDKYCEESIINERQNRINLIVNIDKDYYEIIKYNVEHGQDYKLFKIIANGKLYEERPQKESFIKDITKYVQNMKKYYADGTMCSISESVAGECVCDDILKYLKELEKGCEKNESN